jgi:hypothetical protein
VTTVTDLQLVTIRTLLDSARAGARSGSVIALTTAMLQCDLAIEMALRMACSKGKDERNIPDLYKELVREFPALADSSELRESRRLRDARNTVMHAGQALDQHSVLLWCEVAERAVRLVGHVALDRDFAQVSLAALVQSEPIRAGLQRAIEARAAGDLREAVLCAGGTFQLLRSYWVQIAKPALGEGQEDDDATVLRFQTMALEVFGGIEGTAMHPTELLPLLNLTMGFHVDDLIRLERLLDRFVREPAPGSGSSAVPPNVTETDVDFLIERIADVAWRLELRFPEIVRGALSPGGNVVV